MDNRDNELFNGIIDIPTTNTDNVNPNLEMYTNQNAQSKTEVEIIDVPMDNNEDLTTSAPSAGDSSPEIIDFNLDSQSNKANVQGKVVNHELLQNLNNDTNDLVNPDMIINPLGKSEESSVPTEVNEPKVDYNEIKTKKGYVFMAIIFLIIILFIIFLPKIISFIGI